MLLAFLLLLTFPTVFGALLEVNSQRNFVGLSTFASISALAVGSIFAVAGISAIG